MQKCKLFTSAVAACVAGWSVVPILFAHLLTVPENKHFRLCYNCKKHFRLYCDCKKSIFFKNFAVRAMWRNERKMQFLSRR